MSDLKATFVQKVLAQYLEDVSDTMRIVMKRAGVGVTDESYKSIAYKAIQQNAQGGLGELSFNEALRFVDMGAGRGHPLGGLRSTRISLLSQKKEGLALVKDKVRKPKKIYSKIAYGKLTWLQNQLLYGYTEETIEALKQELSQQQNTTD